MRKLFPVLSLVILMVFGTSANAAQVQEYNIEFQGINGSGVSGEGSLTFDEDKLRANIEASGLEADQTHGVHIHGTTKGQPLECPADNNNEGYMSHDEVHENFDGHALDLTPYPKADTNGTISLDQDYTEKLDKLEPLEEKVVLIHGAVVDGQYDGDVAVACGKIDSANTASASLPSSGGVSATLLLAAAIAPIFVALPTLVLLVRRNNYLNNHLNGG